MITNIKAGIGEVKDNNIVYECTTDIDLDDEEVNVIDEVCRNFGSNNCDYATCRCFAGYVFAEC